MIAVTLISLTACRSADTDGQQAAVQPTDKRPITAQEAQEIALSHAGVKREDARFDRTEYDRDDGVPEYEIEFHADGWEYDYEIHAETGAILSSEKDRDD